MPRVLITGGAGFLGSYTAEQAIDRGWEVTVLDALTYAGRREQVPAAARFVAGDVADPAAVAVAMEGADGILHLAAETHVDRSITGPAIFVRTNVLGTQVIVEAAVRAGVRLLHVSTDEVYGDREGLDPADEGAPFRPSSPYAASKAGAEHLVAAAVRTWGLDAVIARPCNAYGPRQYPEKLVPVLIRAAIEGRPLPLYGDGRQVRDWARAASIAAALIELYTRAPAGAYNLAAHDPHENREIASVLGPWSSVPDRPGHDRRYAMTDAPARALGIHVQGSILEDLPGLLQASRNTSTTTPR